MPPRTALRIVVERDEGDKMGSIFSRHEHGSSSSNKFPNPNNTFPSPTTPNASSITLPATASTDTSSSLPSGAITSDDTSLSTAIATASSSDSPSTTSIVAGSSSDNPLSAASTVTGSSSGNTSSSTAASIVIVSSSGITPLFTTPIPTSNPAVPSIAVSSPSPSVSSVASTEPDQNHSALAQAHPNVGAIAGGVIGGLVLIALAALVFIFLRRRRRYHTPPSAEFMSGSIAYPRVASPPLDSGRAESFSSMTQLNRNVSTNQAYNTSASLPPAFTPGNFSYPFPEKLGHIAL